jgi:hypothetical protein
MGEKEITLKCIPVFIGFCQGLFAYTGLDPNAAFADALNRLVDFIATLNAKSPLHPTLVKVLIFLGIVAIPFLLDLLEILKAGKMGWFSAGVGFVSGFVVTFKGTFFGSSWAQVGGILLVIGALIGIFGIEDKH